jgi:lipid-binding SYLF domain-containing protein
VSAKIGVGGGGAILVGGSNNTFSLQPFNIEAGTGLGWNAGVESLTLTYVPPPPPPVVKKHRRHH